MLPLCRKGAHQTGLSDSETSHRGSQPRHHEQTAESRECSNSYGRLNGGRGLALMWVADSGASHHRCNDTRCDDAQCDDARCNDTRCNDARCDDARCDDAQCDMPNATMPDVMMWHRRLAHLHPVALRSLVNGIRVPNKEQCDVCVQAKHKQRFIHTMVKRVTKAFELVHSDICGPFATPTKINGYRHSTPPTDDHTRWTEVCLLHDKKAESCTSAYQSFQKMTEARGYSVNRFRCDNGRGEYDNKLFRLLLSNAAM